MEFHPTVPDLTSPALVATLYSELRVQDQAGKMTIGSCLKALHEDGRPEIVGANDFQRLRDLVKFGMGSQNETQQKLAKKISDLVVDSPVFPEVEKEERTVFLKASSRSIGHFFTWIGELGRRFHNYLRYGYSASQDMQRALAGAATKALREGINQRTSAEEFTRVFTMVYEEQTQGIPGAKEFLDTFLMTIMSDTSLFEKTPSYAAAASAQRSYTPPEPTEPEPEPISEADFEVIIPSGGAEVFDDIEQIVIETKKRTPPSLAPPDYRDKSPEKLAREEAQRKVDENAPEDPEWRAKTIYSTLRRQRGAHYAAFSKEFSSLTDAELKYLVRYALVALQFPVTRDFATAKTILEEYNRTVIKALHSGEYSTFARQELVELLDECSVEEEEEEKLADLYRAIGVSDSFPE
jgi:hypothetical protein